MTLFSSGQARSIPLNANDPIASFTKLADILLRNTFGYGATNIPVFTNGVFVYSTPVQRLLQFSANLCDAATNRAAVYGVDYPSVFRPLFTVTPAGDLFITGYAAVDSVTGGGDPVFSTPLDVATLAALGATNLAVNVYGVPWIIGAKKGFPNFNQFYQLTSLTVTRKLQVTKPNLQATLDQFRTNQMYVFGITNSLGCSFWNSYTSAYSGNLTVLIRDRLSMTLTNDASPDYWPTFSDYPIISNALTTTNWPGTVWAGANPMVLSLSPNNNSFVFTNATAILLANAIYRYPGYVGAINFLGQPGFDFHNTDYQTNVGTPPLPHFGLITTNRFQACILDTDTNNQCHVIDYVHFAGPDTVMDVNANLADPDYVEGEVNPAYLWSTNGYNGESTPWGVANQIAVSQGAAAPPLGGRWEAPPNLPNYLPQTPQAEQTFFTGFFNINRVQPGVYLYNNHRYTNAVLACQAPYTPTRVVYNFTRWQANDPLVHYLASDLNYNQPGVTGTTQHSDDRQTWMANLNIDLTNINRRYSPWGHSYPYPAVQQSTDATWLAALKDPLVWRSDNWNFPTGPDWPVTTLGRVHRGTPWQTVYLKSTDILAAYYGMSSWAQWVGASNLSDITNSAPVKDWQLAALILPLMNTNDPTQLLSINDANQTNWLDRLNHVTVLSNSAAADPLYYYFVPGFDLHTPNPDQASQIADAIAVTRLNQATGAFQSAGDLLSLTALSENAPWLNWADSAQLEFGITDEAYEAMPSQLLPLLRQDSIGSVVETNGVWVARFSGVEGYDYALQTSTDLVNWTTMSTNHPFQGGFTGPAGTVSPSGGRYYRSVLLP